MGIFYVRGFGFSLALTLVLAASGCGGESSATPGAAAGAGGGVLTGASSTSTGSTSTSTGASTTTSGSAGSGGASSSSGGDPAPFTCSGKRGAPSGTHSIGVESGGVLRASLVHVPAAYDPDAGTMLVLNFHGFSSDGLQEELLTGMDGASDARGFIVAYPYGLFSSWNAGQCCGTAWTDSVDDLAFVSALIDRLEEDYCIDPRRVFATGMSNGGFLSHRLGCDLASRIAAIAPVAGVLGIPKAECTPARPVPVLDFHGTADPLVPFDGGVPLVAWDTGGTLDFVSVADTLAAWRAIDGCSEASEVTYAHGDATCTRWLGCAGGSEVAGCVIDGGGHTWPGGMPIPVFGKTSTDLDATETMLDFFEAHPMP